MQSPHFSPCVQPWPPPLVPETSPVLQPLLYAVVGAIFWMWISALLGMMTIYAEISLGLKYRFKNKLGEWVGGPMFYIERGLGIRWLAIMFAICCTLASFGMGNMAQANSIAVALDSSFSLHPLYGGILIAILCGVVTFGGIRRIATFTEKLVPFMAILYIAGSLIIIFSHFTTIPYSFALIVKEAFNTKAAAGGVVGYGIMQAMKKVFPVVYFLMKPVWEVLS